MQSQTPSHHTVSVVIPVYTGETTLRPLLDEIAVFAQTSVSPAGSTWHVAEVLLVHDNGPDQSAQVIRELAVEHPFVSAIWLSRNFGQHAATLAGMAASTADWIVTMDEDGQHDPADIAILLDTALTEQAPLVYAKPSNVKPHGMLRNGASKMAKWLVSILSRGQRVSDFQSFRLILGSVGRSVASYTGSGVYLDVAIGWAVSRVATADVRFRDEGRPASNYSMRRLASHFWRLVLSSGTRALRIVSATGLIFAAIGLVLAVTITVQRLMGMDWPEGWTSLMTVILISSGLLLTSFGMVAEYLGMAVNMAMGKPPYLVVDDMAGGPLGRRPAAREEDKQN